MNIPDRVIDTILDRAGYDRHNGALRGATARTCPRCRQPVLVGLNADTCALTDTVDPTPLNPAGELTALLTGRYTDTLTWTRGRYELDPRDAAHITTHPAGTDPRREVVAEHRCHQTVPTDHQAPARPAITPTTTDGPPPF